MALSKLRLELAAAAGLTAVMLGGFYYQGLRTDAFAERLDMRITEESARLDMRITEESARLDARITEESARLDARIDGVNERIDGVNERIDGVDERIDERINGVDRRLARIEGLLQAWVSTQSPRPRESEGGIPG